MSQLTEDRGARRLNNNGRRSWIPILAGAVVGSLASLLASHLLSGASADRLAHTGSAPRHSSAPRPVAKSGEELRREFAELVARVRQQPREASFADRTTPLLEAELRSLAPEATALHLDCHSSACVAEIDWSTGIAGEEGAKRLGHHSYRAACGTWYLVPDDVPQPGPTRTQMLFGCDEWVANGMPVGPETVPPARG